MFKFHICYCCYFFFIQATFDWCWQPACYCINTGEFASDSGSDRWFSSRVGWWRLWHRTSTVKEVLFWTLFLSLFWLYSMLLFKVGHLYIKIIFWWCPFLMLIWILVVNGKMSGITLLHYCSSWGNNASLSISISKHVNSQFCSGCRRLSS